MATKQSRVLGLGARRGRRPPIVRSVLNHETTPSAPPKPKPKPKSTKPPWLRQRAPPPSAEKIREKLKSLDLATVCEEAMCPNLGDCWGGGDRTKATATIMLMGDTCTRGCRFCAVNTSDAPPPPDPDEPLKVAEAVSEWGIGYVVLTTVDRDDLPDGGAAHITETIATLKEKSGGKILVEALVGDFKGKAEDVTTVALSGLDVFAHNMETVRRLQRRVRDPRANYEQSLAVLKAGKDAGVYTKSSLMLGLGETIDEIKETMHDLREVGCDILTLGQYLQPTPLHLTVVEYLTPEMFEELRVYGEQVAGFRFVASGPLVRSSYKAGEFFIENMINEDRKNENNGLGS